MGCMEYPQYRTVLLFTKTTPVGSTQESSVPYIGDSKKSAKTYADDSWDKTVRRTDASDVLIEVTIKTSKTAPWRTIGERSHFTGGELKWKSPARIR